MPYAEIDGLRLYFERSGGGRELLFVHGWSCDWTAFRPQFEYFAQTYAVTALDLRGCGKSDRPESGYHIRDLTDDLARFCREVRIERPIVVGHSLGGGIALELAARYPSLPRAVVLVDPNPIDPSLEVVRLFDGFADQLEGPSGEEVRRLWTEHMGARDPELAQWIVDLMCAAPLPIAAQVIRNLNAWNGIGALLLCELPTLLLASSADPEILRLLALKPDLKVGITHGAGHFIQLEVPDQVNAMIERFLKLSS
jgi:pimeloyl-ACP methyl ester carboxylesterase